MNQREYYISISKEQLSALPTVVFPGRITVVDTEEAANEALSVLRNESVVGFDTETKPSFRKGQSNSVALIQVSTLDRCFLFRLKKLGFIDELRKFIEDSSIKKIGLSLHDDFLALHRGAEFDPDGFIDLQSLVKEYGINDISLQKIYGIIFNERISKSQRLSNWEAAYLTDSQQSYASIDAWACLRIYNHLQRGLFDPDSSPYKVHVDLVESS